MLQDTTHGILVNIHIYYCRISTKKQGWFGITNQIKCAGFALEDLDDSKSKVDGVIDVGTSVDDTQNNDFRPHTCKYGKFEQQNLE